MPNVTKRLSPTALVVDDHQGFLDAASRLLQSHDFRVIVARTKAEGLQRFTEAMATLSVVIVDWRLDEFDLSNQEGVELAYEIKRRAPFMPIVCVSAHHSLKEMRGQGLFDLYFEKGAKSPTARLETSVARICQTVEEFNHQLVEMLPEYLRALVEKYQMPHDTVIDLARKYYLDNVQWRQQVARKITKKTRIFSELSIFRSVRWRLELDRS